MLKYRLTPAREDVEKLRMAKTQICKPVLMVLRIQETICLPKIKSYFFSQAIFKSIVQFCILLCTCSASVKLYINSSSSWLTAPGSSCLTRSRKWLQDERKFVIWQKCCKAQKFQILSILVLEEKQQGWSSELFASLKSLKLGETCCRQNLLALPPDYRGQPLCWSPGIYCCFNQVLSWSDMQRNMP